jgi:VCBS repeat-containing protein
VANLEVDSPGPITSSMGAAVTINADGSYTYDPTGSATLQALEFGAAAIDTFQYAVNDFSEGTSTPATVSVRVMGAFDSGIGGASAGDISIFTAQQANDSILSSDPQFLHDFDNAERQSDSHALVGPTDIQLSAGHHLVLYNSRFDKVGNDAEDRSEVQSNLNLAGNDLAAGYSQGYIRTQEGQDETVTAGGAIVNVQNNGDLLQLQSFRTDVDEEPTFRANNATGIQLIKLDDGWDYLSLSGNSGDPTDDQAVPDDETFAAVNYAVQAEVDTGSFGHDSVTNNEDITLNTAGRYLVFANTYGTGASTRTALIQRLTI